MNIFNSILKILGVNITHLDDAEYILKTNLSPIETRIISRSLYEASRACVIVGVIIGTICTLALVSIYLFSR